MKYIPFKRIPDVHNVPLSVEEFLSVKNGENYLLTNNFQAKRGHRIIFREVETHLVKEYCTGRIAQREITLELSDCQGLENGYHLYYLNHCTIKIPLKDWIDVFKDEMPIRLYSALKLYCEEHDMNYGYATETQPIFMEDITGEALREMNRVGDVLAHEFFRLKQLYFGNFY